MKTFWTIGYQKCNIVTIFLVVFLMTFISCQKGNELLPEEKSSDTAEGTDDLGETEGEIFPFTKEPKFRDTTWETLLYRYEDIYIPFSYNKWYKYNPMTNKWYSFDPDDEEKHEIKEYKANMEI